MVIEKQIQGYSRVKCVASFDELVDTRLAGGINAVCWQRALDGDFDEVVRVLGDRAPLDQLDETELRELELGPSGQRAVAWMLRDLQMLHDQGLAPELNYIRRYASDDANAVIATDVYSFHVDRAPVEVDTWLCTYYGAPSQGLPNEQSVLRVNVPDTRSELLRQFGGSEGREFEAFLRENHYDLHFAPLPGARPWSFGVGNLWRVATDWPGCLVPPCIHRAPSDILGQGRLLLIS